MLRSLDETAAIVAGQVMSGGHVAPARRPRVVIRWGRIQRHQRGNRAEKADVDVTVIDRRNLGHTDSHVRIAAKPFSGAIFA